MAKFIPAKTKYDVVNDIITDITSKYIANGYTICTQSMRGSQGELAKIDFFDGITNAVTRVYAMNRYHPLNCAKFDGEVELNVEMFTIKHPGDMETLWNGEGISIETKHLLVNDRGVLVMSHREYKGMVKKHKDRIESRVSRWRTENLTDDRLITTLVGLVRAQKEPGFKRIKLDDVVRAERWFKRKKCSYFLKFTNGKSVKLWRRPTGGMMYSFYA